MSAIETTVDVESVDPRLDAARALVVGLVVRIAPQLDSRSVDYSDSLHDIADIDSLDFLRLVALTADETGVVIPPRDFAHLATIDGFARYIVARQSAPRAR